MLLNLVHKDMKEMVIDVPDHMMFVTKEVLQLTDNVNSLVIIVQIIMA